LLLHNTRNDDKELFGVVISISARRIRMFYVCHFLIYKIVHFNLSVNKNSLVCNAYV